MDYTNFTKPVDIRLKVLLFILVQPFFIKVINQAHQLDCLQLEVMELSRAKLYYLFDSLQLNNALRF